ncbi:MAG TPA: NADH:flavin oxidoreductase, partial [Chloroflexota bacterium]|nr:NADH:flavin oxidoreductase [Chloroflexota bacterium]
MTGDVDRLVKIPTLKTAAALRQHAAALGVELGVDDAVETGERSPLLQPLQWNGRTIGNRWCTQPMEGWDGTATGGVTEPMVRRWKRF